MRRDLSLAVAVFAMSLLSLGQAGAADDATEARLRDALRQAISQNRSLEDNQARLQARIAEQEKQIETLGAKPAGPDKETVERMEAEFNRRLAEQHETAARLGETLEKWKSAYGEAANAARAKETERAQLAALAQGLDKRARSCEAMNEKLFEVGTEILDRYAAMDVADAISAKEPFLGFKRVELQNLVQDYRDKLLDQKVQEAPLQLSVPQENTP